MIKVYEPDGVTLRGLWQTVAEARMETDILPEAVIDAADLLAALKAEAVAAVIAYANAFGDRLTAGYPRHEVQSWPMKVPEAMAIMAGETDPAITPIITAERQITKASPRDLARSVLAKAGPFATAIGTMSGLRQITLAAIDAAADENGINAALADAKAKAEAAFEALSKGL